MIGYTCKYTPVELLAAFGAEPVLINEEAEDFEYAQDLMHMNMCGSIKALIESVHRHHLPELILVNCCDGTRRAADVLKDRTDFLFLMDIPHAVNSCSRQHLVSELKRLCSAYQKYSRRAFSLERFLSSFSVPEDAPSSPYIGVLGARVGEGLKEQLSDLVPLPVQDLTCCSIRGLQLPDEKTIARWKKAAEENTEDSSWFDELLDWYAEELLRQIPCMRMEDITGRKALINDPYLKGIIYHTVKFCDYYGFEYERLRKSVSIPMTKIETDFTMQSEGQLSTRIGGFVESMGLRKERKIKGMNQEGKYFAGIDSGSTTTNIAVLDQDGKLLDSAIVRTGAKAQKGAQKALDSLKKVNPDDIALIFATGYGRMNISFADDNITEITCHARGARHIHPGVHTIIDIGGQDNKAIRLDDKGDVVNFAMNDKCAAGTGRFLENMAKVLEISLDEISTAGLDWKEDLTISSMCTVFAESEVVSLIADNKQIPDIVHGLDKSVAAKTMTLVHRTGGKGPYMMTGGGARNVGVVRCIEDLVGEKIYVPENPDLCGAIGAALFAMDAAGKKPQRG
ncbi:MAG: acyl-CoA dehydratase activase [Eubacterium sp.]|jgi:predicted CoA-substrate-specific enzyme activase|nr:acyl-CoA dehydratase activase [Eubacterium sp.]MCI2196670.1 acyl-CoA dehydratase activase [Eubacterium sp.]